MNDTEKLEVLLRMVREVADEVRALREELERNRADEKTNRQQVAPYNGTWSDPNDTGTWSTRAGDYRTKALRDYQTN